MSVKQSVYELLKDDSTVNALIGSRVWPTQAPWNPDPTTFPRVTLHKVSHDVQYHLGGVTETERTRLQIDCWGAGTSEGHTDVEDLAAAIITAMHGAADSVFGTTNTTDADGIFLLSESDEPETPKDGSSLGANRIRQDWLIVHR